MKKTWKLTIKQQLELRERYSNGSDIKSLCDEYGISESTLYKTLGKYDSVIRNPKGELPDDVIKEVIDMHSIGASASSITRKTGVRWQAVYEILTSRNIKIKFKTKIPEVEEKEMCDMYLSGMSILEIGRKTKRSKETISVILMRNEIGIRPKSETMRSVIKTRESSPSWKGGKTLRADGYISINNPNHPCSTSGGYVLEHRMVVSDSIGRPLKKTEVVHHINGIKTDNRIENLMLVDINKHYGEVECPFCSRTFLIK